MLLFGFAGAFRRSELAGLKVEDLAFQEEGVVATLHRPRTDRQGSGRKVGIPNGQHRVTCPMRGGSAWLRSARIRNG